MMLLRCVLSPVAGLLLIAGSALAAAGPASIPGQVQMRIEVFGVAGLHVLTDRTTVDETADRYQIVMNLQSQGLTGFFVRLNSYSKVVGRLDGVGARPLAFVGQTDRDGNIRVTRATYDADGLASGSTIPASPATRRPITPADTRGTVDQLTAYFRLERQLADGGSCALTVPVFDGRLRYNLVFSPAPAETLPANSDRRYAGPTTVCRMTRQNVAGFSVERQGIEGARSGKIWFARLIPNYMMIPVRMDFETEIGELRCYIAELRGRGVDLHYAN